MSKHAIILPDGPSWAIVISLHSSNKEAQAEIDRCRVVSSRGSLCQVGTFEVAVEAPEGTEVGHRIRWA